MRRYPTIVVAFGSGMLAGEAPGVAKTVNDAKTSQRQLEETKRHNRAIEERGIYLTPYKQSKGVSQKKKRRENDKDVCGCH